MIKITMTNGLVYMASPSLDMPRPAAEDNEAAWQYLPKVYQALREARDNVRRFTNFYRVFPADLIKSLSSIPGVARVENLDPLPTADKDGSSEFDNKGNRVIY
jgi:hypothetical protein